MRIISEEEFNELVLKSDKKVVIDFFANWCGPCKALSPILEDISSEKSNIDFYKVDIDKNQNLAMKYKIMSIPAVFIFEKGEVVTKSIGLKSKEELENML